MHKYIFKTLKVANATAAPSCKIFKFDMTPFLVLNQPLHSMPDQKNQLQSDEQWAIAEWLLSSKEKVAGDIKFLMTIGYVCICLIFQKSNESYEIIRAGIFWEFDLSIFFTQL